MKQIAAQDIPRKIRCLVASLGSLGKPHSAANWIVLRLLLETQLKDLMEACESAGLSVSVLALKRHLTFFIPDAPVTVMDHFADAIAKTNLTIEDELSQKLYFSLTQQEVEMFQNPLKGWDSVIAEFPKMRQNIEESSKCFALERYGASVFHVLQIAEYGVIQVANLLEVAGDRPGWGSLNRLRALIREPYPNRSPIAQKHSKLLEDVVPLALIIKDSWRHKLDHVDNQIVWMDADFSPQVADEIISATRAFMRKLAFDLEGTTTAKKAAKTVKLQQAMRRGKSK